MIRRLLLALAGAASIAAALASVWIAHPALRDPLDALSAPEGPVRVLAQEEAREAGRVIRRVTLEAGALGPVRIAVSLPDPPAGRVPVLFIMGGLRAGRESFRHVGDPGRNAVAAFEYAIPQRVRGWAFVAKLRELRAAAFATPGQAVAALRWLRGQDFADPGRVVLVGVSLGAVFAPAVLRVDQARGGPAGPSVIAYGGADIAALAENWMRPPAWWKGGAARLLAFALAPLAPETHLPYLKGPFLVIGSAERDSFIPAPAQNLLIARTPEPKTVVLIGGGHVGGRRDEVTAELVRQARTWLAAQGAVDP